MLTLDEIESGLFVTHKNTGLRYSVVEAEDGEVLLSPEQDGLQDLTVPLDLFRSEFVATDRFRSPGARRGGGGGGGGSGPRGRKRAPSSGSGASAMPTGPKSRGKIKKMVRDRGFGFIRGEDGKEVFFHRSGLNAGEYDVLNEGDVVEYVVQEGPRGARAEHVRHATAESAPA